MNKIIFSVVFILYCSLSASVLANTANQDAIHSAKPEDSVDDWSDETWEEDDWETSFSEAPALTLPRVRFMEFAIGQRTINDTTRTQQATIKELRTRLEWEADWQHWAVESTLDVVANAVTKKFDIDIRELAVQTTIGEQTDLRIGKQVLSWGVGEYIFLNDLFPKNWQAFFNGRDEEYLKAAANAVHVSHYFEQGNVQFVWFPRFTPDEFVNGQVFSYFNPFLAAQSSERLMAERAHDDEFAFRFFKRFGQIEAALYVHLGREKTPRSANIDARSTDLPSFYFAKMNTYGASVSGAALGGIVKAEVSFGESQEDLDGDNPLVSNSVAKALLGYETELAPKLSGSWQAYVEAEQQYAAMQQTWPQGIRLSSRHRVMFTQWYRYQLWQETVTINLLHMHSSSDDDGYIRANIQYKATDLWHITAGINTFYGQYQDSFFGQFEEANNVYVRIRHYW